MTWLELAGKTLRGVGVVLWKLSDAIGAVDRAVSTAETSTNDAGHALFGAGIHLSELAEERRRA